MRHDSLVRNLEAAGKKTITVDLGNGAKALLLPHGGRILGLFPGEAADNFYWTHPALQTKEDALALYNPDIWENSGGDRTWLGPELELFFPAYPDISMQSHFEPRQMDPGAYRVNEVDGAVQLVNRATLSLYRSRTEAEVEIVKWVKPLANPLRHEPRFAAARDAVFCGYEQHTSLQLLNVSSARLGIWNLTQLPHGGEMILPTYARTEPTAYFGSIPDEDLAVENHVIRYKMRAPGEQKIGIRSVASTGRVGYRYEADGQSSLVIRNFRANPSAEYVDSPWDDPDSIGYQVHICNIDNVMGQFSELEYHSSAVGAGTGTVFCEDVSQVWAFRGSRAAIDSISHLLLGTSD